MKLIKKVGISNQGLDTATTTMIPSSVSPICKQSMSAMGSNSSTAPKSLENRLSIRPELFVLKNRIVAWLIDVNILSCKFREARMHISKKADDRMRVTMIVNTVIPL